MILQFKFADPTGYPLNVHVTEITNTSAVVTWDPVEESKRNSEISGYIIQYTTSDQKDTSSKSVNSPTTLRTVIRLVNFNNFDIYNLQISPKFFSVYLNYSHISSKIILHQWLRTVHGV